MPTPRLRARRPLYAACMSFILEEPQSTPPAAALDFSDYYLQTASLGDDHGRQVDTNNGSHREPGCTGEEEDTELRETDQQEGRGTDRDNEAAAESSESDEEGLIKKPIGVAGRPGSGGYSLDDQLLRVYRWKIDKLEALVVKVHAAAAATLNTKGSYRVQDATKVQEICDKMTSRYPALAKYQNCWPVRDMLKAHLKYTSEQARRAKSKEVNNGLINLIASTNTSTS